MKHLETKKQILALREKFGEVNWLSSQAGTFVQDIMGLQSSSSSSTLKYHDDINLISSEDNRDLISSIENKDLDHTNSENVINSIAVNCKDNGNADKVEEEMHDNEVLNSELTTTLENPADALFDLELGIIYKVCVCVCM